MSVETPEQLGAASTDSSFLSGSLIPKWLHEKFTGVWGRLTHAFDKFKNQKDAGILKRVGAFISGLFEDYKELTQESIKTREETTKKADEIISQCASSDDAKKVMETQVFGARELTPEEKDASDTVLGVASETWFSSPDRVAVTTVGDSLISDKPGVDPKDLTLDQKLATMKFSVEYVKALQKHCKDKNISAEDLAKKFEKFEGLNRFASKIQAAMNVSMASAVSSLFDDPSKIAKLTRLSSQLPIDKLQKGNLDKSDVAPLLPNTSSNSELMETAARVINSAAKGQKVPTIDIARLVLGIHERDFENLIQMVS